MRSVPLPWSLDSTGQGPLWCRTGTHRNLCFLKNITITGYVNECMLHKRQGVS